MSITKDIEDEVEKKAEKAPELAETSPEELGTEGEVVLGAEHFGKFEELLDSLQSLQKAIEARNPDEVKALAARVKESGADVKKIGFVDRFIRGRVEKAGDHAETAGAVIGAPLKMNSGMLKGIFGDAIDMEKITPLLKQLGGSQGSIKGMLGNAEVAGSLGEAAPAATEALAGLEEIAPLLEEAGPLLAAL